MRGFAFLLACWILPTVAFSQSIELKKLKLESIEVVDHNTFIMEYRLRVLNGTADRISGLTASISTDRNDIEILNSEVLIGDVKAFRRKRSKETLLIKVYEGDPDENSGDHQQNWDNDAQEEEKKESKIEVEPHDLSIVFDDETVGGFDLNANGIRDDLESISVVNFGGSEHLDAILDDVLRNRQKRFTQVLSDAEAFRLYEDDFKSALCLRSTGVDVYSLLNEISFREITNDQRRERSQAMKERFATLPSVFENGFEEFDSVVENCGAGLLDFP